MLESGIQAVNAVEGGWEFLRTYSPPADQGFMFSLSYGKRKEIDTEIEKRYPGHSGASYGGTMRDLEFIAKQGWDVFAQKYAKPSAPSAVTAVDSFLASNPPTEDLKAFADALEASPGMKKAIPDLPRQTEALRRFAGGTLTYGQMRDLCG